MLNLKRVIVGPFLSIVFLVLFVYMISGVKWFFDNLPHGQNAEVFSASVSDVLIVPVIPKPQLEAKSAISVESNLNGASFVLFEKDSTIILPIASLTKLMTAIVVLDNYNLSDTVVINKIADSQDPMKQDVKLGDVFPVESLLYIMLIGSSNKSAYALSEGPGEYLGEQNFVALMNQKAKDLGLESTFFADPTGLSQNNVSTAEDLSKLAEHILKNYPKIADISKLKELDVPNFGKVVNTDQLLAEVPDAVCSKTGFTTEAKGCLLLVVNNPKNNDYLINVILGADDRFFDMKELISWANEVCK